MQTREPDVELALLGFLYRQPRHGYEIHQLLLSGDGLGLVWHLNQSQLYALLAKLEQQGYLAANLEPQDARPPRRMLQLTQDGHDAFLSWLQRPVAHGRSMRMEFMAKLYWARQVGPEVSSVLIRRQREVCAQWLAALQARADRLTDEQSFEQLVLQFRAGQVAAMIAWLEACE